MPDQMTERQFTQHWPQIGERWEFTTNTLVGRETLAGTITGYRIHVGLSVGLLVDTGAGTRNINPCASGLETMRRVPHVTALKGVVAEIPDAAEIEQGDPDA